MASDQPSSVNNQTNITKETLSEPRIIFTKEEVESTIKGFVLAYIRGLIKVNFRTAKEIMYNAELEKLKISWEQAGIEEVQAKEYYTGLMEICAGTQLSTPEELEDAKNKLFRVIIRFRSAQRIEGTFIEYDMERRLSDLEKNSAATNNLVAQLVKWLTEEAKAD